MARTPVTIGVDLGGTKLVAAVVHGGGRVSSLRRWPRRVAGYEEALDAIADQVASLRREAEERGETVVAVGVAIAAFLTARRDRVRGATYLTGWDDRPFPADLRTRVGVPVIMENDADAAAWGEFVLGAGRGEQSVVMTTVGTGIGGGIVVDGHLLRGGFGLAGELGHIVVAPGGRPCGCGSRGCLEAYASGTALTRSVRAAAASDPRPPGGCSSAPEAIRRPSTARPSPRRRSRATRWRSPGCAKPERGSGAASRRSPRCSTRACSWWGEAWPKRPGS